MRVILTVLVALGSAGLVAAADAPVATVGDHQITHAQLETHVKAKLIEIENERFEALKEGLDELVAEELFKQEAKARSTTPEALRKQEVEDKVAAPTDAQIQQVYEQNKQALNGQALDAVKDRIVQYLNQQAAGQREEAYIAELKGKHKTTIALRAPTVEVADAGRPAKGDVKAPITIIEFSDYECPFCKRAEPTVTQVLATYGDKIRLVYRDYPLPFHAHARPAANAAACANAQGKFWEYHAKVFAAADLSDEALKKLAAEAGLDAGKFDACFAKKEFDAAIEKDVNDGQAVGVNGTPAFFINGRMISGAQPFEKFKEIIDEELASAGAAKK
ncbi:MAG: thioredoxin domain-containing protein [Candidatus Binatia bacterium]